MYFVNSYREKLGIMHVTIEERTLPDFQVLLNTTNSRRHIKQYAYFPNIQLAKNHMSNMSEFTVFMKYNKYPEDLLLPARF